MIAYGAVGQKISSISESKDGQSFLTTSGDNIISVWFKNGRFEELAQASDKPYSFAVFSPATSVFLAGGPQVKAKCWVDYSVSKKYYPFFWINEPEPSKIIFPPMPKKPKGIPDNFFLTDAAFSQGGDSILFAYQDRPPELWSFDGKKKQTYKWKDWEGECHSVAFSPKGDLVMANAGQKAFLWQLSGKAIKAFTPSQTPAKFTSFAFSPDDSMVLFVDDTGRVEVWNLSGQMLLSISDPQASVNEACFSSDNKGILTASRQGILKRWSLDGKNQEIFGQCEKGFAAIAFSPKGNTVVTADHDGIIYVWDMNKKVANPLLEREKAQSNSRTQPKVVVQSGHIYKITGACFSPKGEKILTVGNDFDLKLWNFHGQLLRTFPMSSGTQFYPMGEPDACFSPDGSRILSWHGKTEKSFEMKMFYTNEAYGFEVEDFRSPVETTAFRKLLFSSDGKRIWGLVDHQLKMWNIRGEEVLRFSAGNEGIRDFAYQPDRKELILGTDQKLLILNEHGELIRLIQDNTTHRGVEDIVFSPNGQQFVTIQIHSKDAQLRDPTGSVLHTFHEPDGYIAKACFSSDGKRIITFHVLDEKANRSDRIKIWSLKGELRSSISYDFPVSLTSPKLMAATNGKGLMVVDGQATLWDESGKELLKIEGEWKDKARDISHSLFYPDNKRLLLGGHIMDLAKLKLSTLYRQRYQAFKGYRWNEYYGVKEDDPYLQQGEFPLAFSSNGNRLLSTSSNLTEKDGFVVTDFKKETVTSISTDAICLLPGASTKSLTDVYWLINDSLLYQPYRKGDNIKLISASMSPVGEEIVTGNKYGFATIYGPDGQKLLEFMVDSSRFSYEDYDPLLIGNFTADGKKFITSTANCEVIIWDLYGNKIKSLDVSRFHCQGRLHDRREPTNYVYAYFMPGDTTILLANEAGKVELTTIDDQYIRSFEGLTKLYAIRFSPDGNWVLGGGDQGILWNVLNQEKIVLDNAREEILSVDFSPNGNAILTGNPNRTVSLWEAQTGALMLTFYVDQLQKFDAGWSDLTKPLENWLIVHKDNYYMVPSKYRYNLIHFRVGDNAYNFDQFDLRLNRPDKILETLLPFGADSALMLQYRQAWYKRLEKYGFTEDMLSDDYHVPECEIQNRDDIPLSTTESSLQLNIRATDSLRFLDRLNIFVNDVPIYGIQGIDLRDKNTKQHKTTLEIPLSQGQNKIQISALNQGGAESLKATTYITCDTPEQKPDLYLITIGVSDYQASGKDLQYAAKDARDIAELYQNADGFGEVHTKVLADKQVTKANILALRAWLEQSRVDDQVLIYVSGHGLLDDHYDFYYATHDIDFAHPAEKGILYDEIEGLLDGIPARKKLLLMDACHSGEYDQDAPPLTSAQQDSLQQKGITFKGFSKGDAEGAPVLGLQNSFEMMQQLFADLRRGSGATVISSSSGVQVSYEDAEWQNGAFTYAFLYGLKSMKADADQDGQVTASEIQAFVAEFVPRLTEGLQVPTFRRENLEFDFRVW